MDSGRLWKVIARHRNGLILAYAVDPEVFGPLEPAVVFRPRVGDAVEESVVRADLERVVYTTLNEVVCLTRSGDPMWVSAFAPHSDVRHGHRPGCSLSPDGRTVWVYRPDVMAQRGVADQWVVYDTDSGEVLARREVETAGHGSVHHTHPVDGSVYLTIGEGQDGAVVLRGVIGADGAPRFVMYPWPDRCLIDLAPGGRQFMSVDHDQGDVAFHDHPSGDVQFTLPVDAFGYDPDDTYVEWSGGYLTPDTAVVTLGGEREDEEEWFRHHLVDVRTGALLGVSNPYEGEPLGDGSWLTQGADGHPVRRSLPTVGLS
ncbi:hypothetical protein [Streptomyces yangpuensis]|uniref:hypothetical protein n=1 Tax=Streptomyces yangpuensis TaxID=1648182 RepID=UPI0006295861|nr:hypothetical protein [Streptomyces yangpuensis]